MTAGLNINILHSTVRRRLIAAGLYGRVAATKALLSPQNKMKRLKFANKHQDWMAEQWKRLLWSYTENLENITARNVCNLLLNMGETL